MTPIGLDTETELITDECKVPRLVCMSLTPGTLIHHTEASEWAYDLLSNPDVLCVAHNAAYDFSVLASHCPPLFPLIFEAYTSNRIVCTQVRQQLLDLACGKLQGFDEDDEDGEASKIDYGLASTAYRLTGRRMAKGEDTWRKRYGELRDLPIESWPEAARTYAIGDAQAHLEVYQAQAEHEAWLEDCYRQSAADFWLALMSAWGLTTDPAGVNALARRIETEWGLCADVCREAKLLRKDTKTKTGVIVPGTRDTKATANRIEWAFINQGSAVPRTPTGRPKTDRRTCINSGDPVLVKYSEMSAYKKQLSTDIPLLYKGATIPLHARFNVLVDTGRTSSKPNVQNQKTKGGFRECFVPRPGYAYVSWDYSGAELCTLAEVCTVYLGRSRLAELLNAGMDPHLTIAASILGQSYESLLPRKANPEDKECYYARQCGKIVNFGCPGGLGPKALVNFAQQNYGVTLTEAKAYSLKNEIWLPAVPEMREYFAFIDRLIKSGKPYQQLYSGRWRGGMIFTEACNTPFQGLAADMIKDAGFRVSREMYTDPTSPLFGSHLVNCVHDELIAEVPIDNVHDAAARGVIHMQAAGAKWCPHVKTKTEPVAMMRWSKLAKPVYAEGRLIPWAE